MNEDQHSELLTANKFAEVRNWCTFTYKIKYKREN